MPNLGSAPLSVLLLILLSLHAFGMDEALQARCEWTADPGSALKKARNLERIGKVREAYDTQLAAFSAFSVSHEVVPAELAQALRQHRLAHGLRFARTSIVAENVSAIHHPGPYHSHFSYRTGPRNNIQAVVRRTDNYEHLSGISDLTRGMSDFVNLHGNLLFVSALGQLQRAIFLPKNKGNPLVSLDPPTDLRDDFITHSVFPILEGQAILVMALRRFHEVAASENLRYDFHVLDLNSQSIKANFEFPSDVLSGTIRPSKDYSALSFVFANGVIQARRASDLSVIFSKKLENSDVKFFPLRNGKNWVIQESDNFSLLDQNGSLVLDLINRQSANVGISPDGRFLAEIRVAPAHKPASHEVVLWNLQTKQEVGVIGDATKHSQVSFSADSRYVVIHPASIGAQVTLHNGVVYDTVTGNNRSIPSVPSSREEIHHSPDGTYMMFVSALGEARLETYQGDLIGEIPPTRSESRRTQPHFHRSGNRFLLERGGNLEAWEWQP